MCQLTPEIPFMASLWIKAGCEIKAEVSAEKDCIIWGLILKLSTRSFLLHHPESLRIFFHFMSPCCAVCHENTLIKIARNELSLNHK